MLEYFEQHPEVVAIAMAIILAVFVLCVIAKLFRIAIGLAVMCVVIPIIFTIFWGDGHAYIEKVGSFLQPAYQQQLVDAYNYFKDKDAEDPFIDYDAVSSAVTATFDDFRAKGEQIGEDADKALSEWIKHLENQSSTDAGL